MNSAQKKIRWGILGPGTIAKAFAGGVAHSRTGRLVAIGARNPGKAGLAEAFPGARILDGYDALLNDPEVDAIYISTPHPSHAEWAIKAAEAGKHVLVRKADGPHRLRGRRDDPCGAQGRDLPRRSLHVSLASADREAGRTGQIRCDRRRQDDQVELRLRHAWLHAGAPALCQRSRRRRHSGCRRLPGLDGAPDRWRSSGTAVRRAGPGGRCGASRPVRRRRVGLGAVALSRRHRRRSLLQHLAQPGQRAAHHRNQGPHRGQGFLVRRRQGRRHRQDRDHPPGRQRDRRRQGGSLALFLRGRCRRRGHPRGTAGVRLAGHGLGRQSRQFSRARQMARRGRPRIRDREGGKPRQHDFRPAAAHRRHGDRQARRSPACRRGPRSWRSASRISPPSRRARSCSTPSSRPAAICSTPASSMAAAAPRRCSASG